MTEEHKDNWELEMIHLCVCVCVWMICFCVCFGPAINWPLTRSVTSPSPPVQPGGAPATLSAAEVVTDSGRMSRWTDGRRLGAVRDTGPDLLRSEMGGATLLRSFLLVGTVRDCVHICLHVQECVRLPN